MGKLKQFIVFAKAGENFYSKFITAPTKNRAHIEMFDRIIAEKGKPFKFNSIAIQIPFIRRKA